MKTKKPKRPMSILQQFILLLLGAAILILCTWCYVCVGHPNLPAFDPLAISGAPDALVADRQYSYLDGKKSGIGYSVGLVANPKYNETSETLAIYMANPADNTVNIKCRLYNTDGTMLAQSGLIKPGEYIQSLDLNGVRNLISETCEVQIMGYEPETYYSAGAFIMEIQPEL